MTTENWALHDLQNVQEWSDWQGTLILNKLNNYKLNSPEPEPEQAEADWVSE
jgi:hypothetical protein